MSDGKAATLGMIGGGSMGGGWALNAAEKGDVVVVYDTTSAALEKAEREFKKINHRVYLAKSIRQMVDTFDVAKNGPRCFVMSLPHGHTVDLVLSELLPLLSPGDIVIDGGNEWWEETERRQGLCVNRNINYIGTGVSGGYQASRRGPSISPSGTPEAYAAAKSRLEKWAARDGNGKPCTTYIGPGGSGHYVKMVHNGIEQGHLSILAEAHQFLRQTCGLPNEETADLFDEWNGTKQGEELHKKDAGQPGKELYDNYLVKIGAEILRFKKGHGLEMESGIVDGIEDKVTQDVDNSEGTGVWTMKEIAQRHVAGPTITAAHQLRIVSAYRGERLNVKKLLDIQGPKKFDLSKVDKKQFLEDVRLAVYSGILSAFVQGLGLIARAAADQNWDLNFENILGIWRHGCIIQSDGIANILSPIYKENPKLANLLENPKVAKELYNTYPGLKRICAISLETDAITPSFDATLGWLKQVGSDNLPTSFEEAQLDYFGHHQYDIKKDKALNPTKGPYHTEWKPA